MRHKDAFCEHGPTPWSVWQLVIEDAPRTPDHRDGCAIVIRNDPVSCFTSQAAECRHACRAGGSSPGRIATLPGLRP